MVENQENIFELSCNMCKTIFKTDVGTVFVSASYFKTVIPTNNTNSSDSLIKAREDICFSKRVVCPKCNSVDSYNLTRASIAFLLLETLSGNFNSAQNLDDFAESKIINKKIEIPKLVISEFIATIKGKQTKILPRLAEKYCREELEAGENNAMIHEKLGNLLRTMFRFEEAIEEYKKAIELDSNLHSSYYNMGLLYIIKDDLNKASEMFLKMAESSDKLSKDEKLFIIDIAENCLNLVAGLKIKGGFLPSVQIDGNDVSNVSHKILTMSDKDFPGSIRKAGEKFGEETFVKRPENKKEKHAVDMEFVYWYITEYQLENGKAPIEHYYEKKEGELTYKERKVLEGLMNCKRGIFEVERVEGKNYFLVDLMNKRKYIVTTNDMPPLSKGSMITARLIQLGANIYGFLGAVSQFDAGMKESIGKDMEELFKRAGEFKQKFVEYFKSSEIEFRNSKKLNEAMKNFTETMNRFVKSDLSLALEELLNKDLSEKFKAEEMDSGMFEYSDSSFRKNERIGLVFSKWINVVPYYGYLKDMLAGKLKEVPDYEELLISVVKDGMYIPGYLLKDLIEKNKKTCIKAFKGVFPWVRNLDDIMSILEVYRSDLNEEEIPQLFIHKGYDVIENLIEKGDLKEANELIESYLKRDEEDIEMLFLKFESLFRGHEFDGAYKILDKCEELQPNNPYVYFHRATMNFFRLRFFDALEEIDKSLKLDSDNFDFVMTKASILHQLGRREYIQWVDKAGKIDKERADEFMKTSWIKERLLP